MDLILWLMEMFAMMKMSVSIHTIAVEDRVLMAKKKDYRICDYHVYDYHIFDKMFAY